MTAWVRSFIHDSLYDSDCEGAFSQIRESLIDKTIFQYILDRYSEHPQSREVLFDILGFSSKIKFYIAEIIELTYSIGPDFTEKYFQNGKGNISFSRQPELIHPPYMLEEMKHALREEVERDLLEHLNSKMGEWIKSSSFENFRDSVKLLAERAIRDENVKTRKTKCDLTGEVLSSHINSNFFSFPMVNPEENRMLIDYYQPEEMGLDEETNCMFHQFGGIDEKSKKTDLDPAKHETISKLTSMSLGRSIPASIRRLLYQLTIYSYEHTKETIKLLQENVSLRSNQATSEDIAEKGRMKSKLFTDEKTVKSKIYNLLTRLVNETFRTSFEGVGTEARRNYILQALNVHYIAFGEHKASYIYLAIPLMLDVEALKLPIPVFVSMLKKLYSQGLPGSARLNNSHELAESSFRLLGRRDGELSHHIRSLYEQHRMNIEKLNLELDITHDEPVSIFLGWIERGLSGVLRQASVQFIWGQILISHCIQKYEIDIKREGNEKNLFGSAQAITENACVTIFILLREQVLKAGSVSELEHLMSKEPNKILTRDFRRMFNKNLDTNQV